mmetsp:Transcript_26003/g.85569  ORF Transcript_26003/g.85569 Transcript_26003/m.85569 type:complete len:499 (+) Transcript_26003:589-2085(+)
MEVMAEALNLVLELRHLFPLVHDLLLLSLQLQFVVSYGELQITVGLMVSLKLVVHLLDLKLHVGYLELARLNLLLELLDLVVEHELELLQLLVLLLQIVNSLLLVPDRLVPLPDLLLQPRDLLLQHRDLVVELLLPCHQLLVVVLGRLYLLQLRMEFLPHDPVLSLQPKVLLSLCPQLRLVLVLELLDLLVCVLLHLLPCLFQLPHQLLLLVPHSLKRKLLLLQLVLVLVRQLLHEPLVRFDQQRVLLVPSLVQELLLIRQLPIPLHLRHDLLLVLRLHLLHSSSMPLLNILDLLLILHLHLALLRDQALAPRFLSLQLAAVLLSQLRELVLGLLLLESDRVLSVRVELVDLVLQVNHVGCLLLQVALGDQDLLRERQDLLLLLRPPDLLVPHVQDQQRAVLRHREQMGVIVCDTHPRDSSRVAQELLVLRRQRELPTLHGSVLPTGEEHPPRVRQADLRHELAPSLELLGDVRFRDLLDLLVASHSKRRPAVRGADA